MSYRIYLTTYKGNKLPPFYVGSTSDSKLQRGYRGSVASKQFGPVWRAELKSNPQLFRTQVLSSRYETRIEAYEAEDRLLRQLDVVRSELYVNLRCAAGLGHHPRGEESCRYKQTHTPEARAKISATHRGKIISEKHKLQISKKLGGRTLPELHRRRISASMVDHVVSSEARQKMSEKARARRATPEQKAKRAAATAECRWWTNGTITKFCKDQPPGWVRGRTRNKE
jgi:hypothetical protein